MRLLKGSAGRNGAPRPSAPAHRSLRRQAPWDGEGVRALGPLQGWLPPQSAPPAAAPGARGRKGAVLGSPGAPSPGSPAPQSQSQSQPGGPGAGAGRWPRLPLT